MKNEGARVVTLYSYILDAQVQQTLLLIQAFMCVLVTCKTEEDTLKNEGARVVIKDLPL